QLCKSAQDPRRKDWILCSSYRRKSLCQGTRGSSVAKVDYEYSALQSCSHIEIIRQHAHNLAVASPPYEGIVANLHTRTLRCCGTNLKTFRIGELRNLY